MFTWYEELPADVESARSLGLCRIGAAALLAGVPSIAIRAADCLLRISPDPRVLRPVVLGGQVRSREIAESNMRGGYLGVSPADALADFLTLVERLQPALSDS
jgi:hypothetical protein